MPILIKSYKGYYIIIRKINEVPKGTQGWGVAAHINKIVIYLVLML